jgi:prepilin signal peptidase PulO-like enzyme (type II secretory pathway)
MFSDDSPFAEWFWPTFWYWFWYLVVFIYGSVVGSFLNVIIYRLPLVKPGQNWLEAINGKSYCPHCRNELRPWQNVPIFGFLFLRGKCHFCKSPISWRYIMVEFTNACLWMALYHRVATNIGITWLDFVFQALFGAVLVALVFIDLDHFIAPDELNLVGFLLGLGRDIACFGMAYYIGTQLNQPQILKDFGPQYVYFGWLPHALVGALVYMSILFAVSYLGFVYYAKGERENLAEVSRRFFTLEDLPEEKLTEAEKEAIAEEARLAEADQAQGPPPRLRFSPGFLAVLCALLLIPSFGFVAPLAFVLPFLGFIALSRKPDESLSTVSRRFFSSNDLQGPPEKPTVQPATPPQMDDLPLITTSADLERLARENPIPTEPELVTPTENLARTMQEEADAFAQEAESGKFGGMGLGDVKLAAAIGALLGPGMALLSLFFATLIGAVVGIIFTRMHGRSLRYGVPFVPFMAAGAIIVMLFGDSLINWYLIVSGVRKPEPPQEPPRLMRPRPRIPRSATPSP